MAKWVHVLQTQSGTTEFKKKVKQYFDELKSQDADWYYPNKTGEHKGTTIVPKWLWPLVDMVKFVQLLYPY